MKPNGRWIQVVIEGGRPRTERNRSGGHISEFKIFHARLCVRLTEIIYIGKKNSGGIYEVMVVKVNSLREYNTTSCAGGEESSSTSMLYCGVSCDLIEKRKSSQGSEESKKKKKKRRNLQRPTYKVFTRFNLVPSPPPLSLCPYIYNMCTTRISLVFFSPVFLLYTFWLQIGFDGLYTRSLKTTHPRAPIYIYIYYSWMCVFFLLRIYNCGRGRIIF